MEKIDTDYKKANLNFRFHISTYPNRDKAPFNNTF